MQERLQKLLSQWGIASRRQAERLIADGRVQVNGLTATIGQKADPTVDVVTVNGKVLSSRQQPNLIYLLLHKPSGVISTCSDPQHRPTVLDLVKPSLRRQGIYPVGRLDADTTGALLLTNDGELTYQLTHPRHSVPKAYRVEVLGHPTPKVLKRWSQGVKLDGRLTRRAKVRQLGWTSPTTAHLEIVLWEGRNRQIRRMAEILGHPVVNLHRVSLGPLEINAVPCGHYRCVSPTELTALKSAISLAGATGAADSVSLSLPNYC